MSGFEYNRRKRKPGSNMIEVEVSRNGRPFGMIWTFVASRREKHPWHSKPLNGDHAAFYGRDGLNKAKAHMEAH